MNKRASSAVCAGAVAAAFAVPAAAQESITVAYYGGNFGDAIKTCVVDTFTKETGIRVVPEVGVSTVTLSKLQQQKDKAVIDVAWIDGGVSEVASDSGVLAAIDPARVPNIASVIPEGLYRDKAKQIYAVGTGFYSVGIAYNTKEVKTAPTSWADLWKPEYADLVTIPSPANAAGVPFIAMLAKLQNVPLANPGPVFARIRQLKAAAYYDSAGQASNLMQSGEAKVAAVFNVSAWGLADKGLPIGFVIPKEGALANDIRVHIARGTPKMALAERFVNHAISPRAAGCLADNIYVGPVTKGAPVSAKAAERLPWGRTGSVSNLALFDWNDLNARRSALQDLWNREIARK